MSGLSSIKEYLKKKQEPEQKTAKQGDEKEQAEKVRKSGEEVKDALKGIRFVCNGRGISREKLECYETIVKGLIYNLENSSAMALDVTVIDESMIEAVSMLQEAISKGYEKTAKEVCEYLNKGISEVRKPIECIDPLEREAELEKKNSVMIQEAGVLKYKLQLEKIEKDIAELEQQVAGRREKYREAYNEFVEYTKEHPDVARALDRVAVEKPSKDISGDVLVLNAKKGNVVAIANGITQAKGIIGVKEFRRSSIIKAIETMENEIRLTKNRLSPHLIVLQEQMQKDIEEALVQEKKETALLDAISAEFDAAMQAFFSDPDLILQMLQVNMDFDDLMNELAERQANIQANAQANEQQNIQNNMQSSISNMQTV